VASELLTGIKVLKNTKICFHNIQNTYKSLLTVSITVADADERRISCLKLMNTYLKMTVTQEILFSLETLSTEYDIVAHFTFGNLFTNLLKQIWKNIVFSFFIFLITLCRRFLSFM